jgi:hypothetical protein
MRLGLELFQEDQNKSANLYSAAVFFEVRFIELASHFEAEIRSFDCCLLIV